MGAALAVLARLQAAVLIVAVDQVALHVQYPAQLAAGRGTVLDLVVAQGQGLAQAVVLGEVAGGALQVGYGLAALLLVRRACQAHAVVGAVTRLVGRQAHGLGQPGAALGAVASLLGGAGGGVVVIGARSMTQRFALEGQGLLRVALALGNGGAQRPVVGTLVRRRIPVTAGGVGVTGVQRATGGGQARIVGPGAGRQAVPDRQRRLGVAGGFQGVGQGQATAAIAQAFGCLVVDHRFAWLIRHGAAPQGAILPGFDRGGRDGLAHGVALAGFGQAAQ